MTPPKSGPGQKRKLERFDFVTVMSPAPGTMPGRKGPKMIPLTLTGALRLGLVVVGLAALAPRGAHAQTSTLPP
ncbi:MAG TPA: hypothetical protein VHG72_18120, partial [Polyangia bacterium]|nr:hypothetical protein [Polyangia bacterium]